MKNSIFVLAIAFLAIQPALAGPTAVFSSTQFSGFSTSKPEWFKHHHKGGKQHLPKTNIDTNATKLHNTNSTRSYEGTIFGDKYK